MPIEDTIGAIADLIRGGYVRFVGLSEAGAENIRRAHAARVGNRHHSLWRPVARTPQRLAPGSGGRLPRHAAAVHRPEPRPECQAACGTRRIARERNATSAHIAIAWALCKGEDIVPVIGSRARKQLAGAVAALEIRLSPEECALLETPIDPAQVAGTLYGAGQIALLDSER